MAYSKSLNVVGSRRLKHRPVLAVGSALVGESKGRKKVCSAGLVVIWHWVVMVNLEPVSGLCCPSSCARCAVFLDVVAAGRVK
jgi:hypothetical protein